MRPPRHAGERGAAGLLVLPALAVRRAWAARSARRRVQWLTNSEIMAISGELRWAAVEGLASAPDVALRLWGTRLIGTRTSI